MNLRIALLLYLIICAGNVFSQVKKLRTVVQKGHEAVVKATAFTPDGKILATASRDQTIKIWEVATGREIRTLFGHQNTVNDLDISSDGKLLLSSSADGTAKIWDLESGELLLTTPKENNFLTGVAFGMNAKYFAVAGYQSYIRIRDVKNGELIKELKADPDRGLGLGINMEFSPDGKMLAVGEDNRLLKVYYTNSWDTAYTLPVKRGSCGGCATFPAFSRDGKLLAKAVNGGSLTLHEAKTGREIFMLKEDIEDLRSVDFDNEAKKLMLATEDSVFQYDVISGKLLHNFAPIVREINQAGYHPFESWVVVAGNDNRATFWDPASGKLIRQFSGILQEQDKGGINYDPDNYWQSHLAKYVRLKSKLILKKNSQQLIRGKFGKLVKAWDLKSGKTMMEYAGHTKAVLSLALTRDEKRLISGDGDGRVIIWNADTGDSLSVLDDHRGPVWDIRLSHDQKKFVSVSWDGHAHVRDLVTGRLLSDIYFGNRSAFSVSFSSNDLYIIAGLLDQKLEMFEIDTKTSVREFVGHTDVVSEIRTLPGGDAFVTVSWDGSARLWDMPSGLMRAKHQSQRPLQTCAYAEKEKMILVAGDDRKIHILDAQRLILKSSLKGHQSSVASLQLHEEAGLLVSNGLDGVTKIWDLDKRREFFEHIHIGKKDWMVKTESGYFNATEGARRVIHFVKDNKTYGADQFFNSFYRPDLIPDLFSVRGGAGQRKSILENLNKFPPPEVKLAVQTTEGSTKAILYAKVRETSGRPESLKLFHNGKRIATGTNATTKEQQGGNTLLVKTEVSLIGGKNVFGAIAVGKGGIESPLTEKDVFSNQKTPSANCYVMAIGINDYQNNSLDLNYARSDAESFTEALKRDRKQLFNEIAVTTLYDGDATRQNILDALDDIAGKASINDVFIFYYAGHGSVAEGDFYFIPTETSRLFDVKNLQKTAIKASQLQEKFKSLKALKQVIIMDACQSGQSAELLAQRGSVEEKAIAQLSRSAGIHVLASAGSEQFASEFKSLQHGLFTFVLLKALEGEADGSPREGKVTLFELKSYLDDQVPEMSMRFKGKPQYPYTFSRGNDFPLKVIDY